MKKPMFILILLVLAIAFAACQKKASRLVYPETKKVDQADDYFGTLVPDPYRWLEDDNAEDTKAWVEAENKVTFGYLDTIPYRPLIKTRLTEIFNYPRYSSPFRVGEHYFFAKNDGLQNQSVYYVQKGLDGPPEVFIDPNALSPDGTVRIGMLGSSLDDDTFGGYISGGADFSLPIGFFVGLGVRYTFLTDVSFGPVSGDIDGFGALLRLGWSF